MSDPKKKKSSSWIPLIIFLLFTNPVLIIPVAVFGGIFWLAYQGVKKQQGSAPSSTTRTYTRTTNGGSTTSTRTVTRTTTRYTTRQDSFDECSQPFFCRHKDKAVHHVRRGKEVDPWDRPDIDISKYQRNH